MKARSPLTLALTSTFGLRGLIHGSLLGPGPPLAESPFVTPKTPLTVQGSLDAL